MITNGNIDEIYKNVFNMLCCDFRKGTKQFEHEFKMRIFEGTKGNGLVPDKRKINYRF